MYGKVGHQKAARAGPYTKTDQNDAAFKDADLGRMVYVGNLPYKAKWQDLKDHMKMAGNVEFARILTEDGTEWGRSRGVGVVRFATETEAQCAIASLNETTLQGRSILVDTWTGSSGTWRNEQKEWSKGKGKDYSKAFIGKGFGKAPYKGFGFNGSSIQVNGDPSLLIYVGNLAYEVKWQDLKDHMRQAGNVEFCRILTEDGSEWGKSKGTGCVRYATAEEAEQAISTLNETELKGRNILVDHWTSGQH